MDVEYLASARANGVPAHAIAARLGMTRNAVLKKACHLKLPLSKWAPPASESWTDEAVEYLTAERAKGTPASVIAKHLKLSKGAVCGKADRLGLSAPNNPDKKPRRESRRVERQKRSAEWSRRDRPMAQLYRGYAPSIDPIVDGDAPPSRNLTLIELGDHDCRYGTSEDEQDRHLFCGAPQQGESSYCAHHHAMCYRPTRMLTDSGPRSRGFKKSIMTHDLPIVEAA